MSKVLEPASLAIRIQVWISFLIRLSFVAAGVFAFFRGEWEIILVTVAGILCLSFPSLLKRNYKIVLPTEFEFAITVFIYAAILLGEVHGFYDKFLWWDIVLHTGSGIALGFIGFLILYTLYDQKRLHASAFMISLLSFAFATGGGAVWEIFEFAMDNFFGTNMQKSADDTMWDLIVNALGALLASGIGFLYIKRRKTERGFFHYLVRRFLEHNRRLRS